MKIRILPVLFLLILNSAVSSSVNAAEVIVETYKYKFIPEELTVKVGTTVKWYNKEKRQYHSVWFKAQGEEPGGYFFPEESVSKTFTKAGRYPYVCEPHEKRMKGVIIVE